MNAIDTRDLADVYLSSTYNEPSSNDISKSVKRYITEGDSIQPKAAAQAPLKKKPPVNPLTFRSSAHTHELNATSSSRRSSARCDVCNSRGNCAYFCQGCDFDICDECVRREREATANVREPILPPTELEVQHIQEDNKKELCNAICSFSLDPSASR